MTEEEVYKELSEKSPTGYRLNELIKFSYPVRKLRIDALVNKKPEGSLVKVYNVLVRAIQAGFDTQKKLFEFLGLSNQDEFVLRELFTLRQKDYVDLVSDKWRITSKGERFIEDEKILRVEEEEEMEFYMDGINGNFFSCKSEVISKNRLPKFLKTEIKTANRSPELLENKFDELAEVYRHLSEDRAYLISYSEDEIKFDSYKDGECGLWINYWLVEYIPERNSNLEPKLEVRTFESLKPEKDLTIKFNAEYKHFIYELSGTDRNSYEELRMEKVETKKPSVITQDYLTLTIWETKHKFLQALQNVKQRILIESPWIKRATQEYIPLFENILKEGKQLIILYGISEKDEHDINTLEKVKQVQKQNKENFILIHLPTHFERNGSKLSGTHRKLVIKDNDYYIAGSFNFLSFGKNEKQQVANEESLLISKDVDKKWDQVIKEYGLKT